MGEERGRAWTTSQGAMIGLAALALVAFALAMRIQRRGAEQTELAAGRKVDWSARLGRAPARQIDYYSGGMVAMARAGASAHPSLLRTLKSSISAAAILTIAVTIYLQSQKPAAIKNLIAHFRQAATTSMPTP